jgi:two-component system, NarL family, sensor histidine kinase DesK
MGDIGNVRPVRRPDGAAAAGGMARTGRGARWAVVALDAAVLSAAPLLTVLGGSDLTPSGPVAVVVPLSLAILGLQLRHSRAAAAGRRPRGAPWTLLALALLVYVPMPWFGRSWAPAQLAVMASALMLLPRWPAAGVVGAAVAGVDVAVLPAAAGQFTETQVLRVCSQTVLYLAVSMSMYGAVRLVRLADELRAARADLSELAVWRERLRVSWDLLRQSLAAISLKGDLAVRLLPRDPPAAVAEIEALTTVARDALRAARAVTADEDASTLATELEGAVALLRAAGIETRLAVDVPDLPAREERCLARAVREGVTNALRHSHAATCSITGDSRDGVVYLEVVNDGAPGPAGEGGGLAGLREHASGLSGSLSAGHVEGDRFRLLVEVPEET